MITIYVRKKIDGRDNKTIEDVWFPVEDLAELPDTLKLCRELVADAAISDWEEENPGRNGEYTFKSNKVNLYVLSEGKELVSITNANFAAKTEGVVEFYAYVPAPPAPTTEVKEGGGDDQEQAAQVDTIEWDAENGTSPVRAHFDEVLANFDYHEDNRREQIERMKKHLTHIVDASIGEVFWDMWAHVLIYILPSDESLVLNMKEFKHGPTDTNALRETEAKKLRKLDGVLLHGSNRAIYENSLSLGTHGHKRHHTVGDRGKLDRARGRAMAEHATSHTLSTRFLSLQLGVEEEEKVVFVEGRVTFVHGGAYWNDTLFHRSLSCESPEDEFHALVKEVHAFWKVVKVEAHRALHVNDAKCGIANIDGDDETPGDEGGEAYPPHPRRGLSITVSPEKKGKKKGSAVDELAVLSNTMNARVFLCKDGCSVIKMNKSREAAETELRALVVLQKVSGVVRLLDMHPITLQRGLPVLTLEKLQPIPWHSLPKDLRQTQLLMKSLVRTVSEVHAAGWAHRDLKPDNIFLRRDGQPVLLDFNTAGAADAQHDAFAQMGTAGFTFWDSPAKRAWQHDSVCLGVVLGLALGVDHFGDPDNDSLAFLCKCGLDDYAKMKGNRLRREAADACLSLLNAKSSLGDSLLLPFFACGRAPLGQRNINVN